MTASSVDTTYPYKGVELKPHMLCELAEKYFPPGSILQRKWLINDAPRIHLELGGRPTTADATSQAKKHARHYSPGTGRKQDLAVFDALEILDL